MDLISHDTTFNVLSLVALATVLIYFYITVNFSYWKRKGVKEISPNFLFGNVGACIFARKMPREVLMEIYHKSEGEKFVGFYVFNKPYLMIRDPELIRHIFIKDFSNFSNKLACSSEKDTFGSSNLFLSRNPPWKFIRQKLSPVYTSGKIKKMFGLLLEVCEDLNSHLENLGVDDDTGMIIDVRELSAKFTTDLIGSTAYGLKLNSLKDPNAEFRKTGRDMYSSTYRRYYDWLSIMLVPQLRSILKSSFFDSKGTDFLRKSFWYTIEQRMKTGIRRNDVIDFLIDIKRSQDNDENDEYKLEGDALVAQAAVFFSGGFETSSTKITYSLHTLATNQDIQTKLRNEILDALEKSGGKVTYEMVKTLPYLDMFVHEILRMYPIIPWLDRLPDDDYTLPGTNIKVTSGTPIILPMRMLQMDPKYFPEPEKFDPERFSEENKKNITPFTYFPFGEGPRNCIGSRLGLIQVKLGIIYFVKNYILEPCSKTSIPIEIGKLTIFLQPEGRVYLNVKKISH